VRTPFVCATTTYTGSRCFERSSVISETSAKKCPVQRRHVPEKWGHPPHRCDTLGLHEQMKSSPHFPRSTSPSRKHTAYSPEGGRPQHFVFIYSCGRVRSAMARPQAIPATTIADPYATDVGILCSVYLTKWSRALVEKLIVSHIVKKFPTFCGNRSFISTFTSVRHLLLSWARSIQSVPPISLLEDSF
jgi:hypothetical protein